MSMLSPNRLGFAIAFALLCSCSSTPPATSNSTSQAQAPSPVAAAAAKSAATSPAADTPARHESFSAWQSDFRRLALSQGISVATLDQALAGLEPDPAVIAADSSQPEFTRPVWEYLDGAVSASRVKRGQQLQVEYAATLSAIEQRYAVDAQVLLAVWGMESAFGHNIGNKSVIRSLASLAYAGRRASFWQEQLLAALRILDAGDISARGMIGSWAGAMGQTQFMPTTYASHAVDFDGDGRRDIWNSASDALGSAAHYLHASGWQAGKPWGFQVALPDNFDYALADTGIRKTYAQWNALGHQGHTAGAGCRRPRLSAAARRASRPGVPGLRQLQQHSQVQQLDVLRAGHRPAQRCHSRPAARHAVATRRQAALAPRAHRTAGAAEPAGIRPGDCRWHHRRQHPPRGAWLPAAAGLAGRWLPDTAAAD